MTQAEQRMTFAERCEIAEQCVPESEFRERLTALHQEMQLALEVRDALLDGLLKLARIEAHDGSKAWARAIRIAEGALEAKQ